MNAACMPNGAATRFVPGSGIILHPSVLPPTLARRGRQRLPPDLSRPRRTGRCLLVSPSLQFDFMVLRALRFEPIMAAPQISRRKRQTKKPRREGPTARRGFVGPRRKRGSPSTRPTCGMLSSKGVAVGTIRDSGTRKLL
jgi:hypothetical protein